MIWTMALLVPIAAMSYGYFSERRAWNSGVSLKSGTSWVRFDTDSQGGRGYKDSEGNVAWISYPGIDRQNAKE